MDALGIQKFSVLGWSDGGIAGLMLAALSLTLLEALWRGERMRTCLKKTLHVTAQLEICQSGARKCSNHWSKSTVGKVFINCGTRGWMF